MSYAFPDSQHSTSNAFPDSQYDTSNVFPDSQYGTSNMNYATTEFGGMQTNQEYFTSMPQFFLNLRYALSNDLT